MTAMAMEEFVARLAPSAVDPVPAELLRARDSIRAALTALRDVSDAALERPWGWRGADLDVRYGFYRAFELMEDVRARTLPLLAAARVSAAPARPMVAAASSARWDLHGVLAGLDDDDLDRDPGSGEWTVRQTLAHIVSGQRGYAWYTAWWLCRPDAAGEELPPSVPDDAIDLPEEETEAEGSIADIQGRFDEIVDLSVTAFADVDAAGLAARARWSGLPVEVRFRLVRWGSHVREHTIQVEKTLGFIGRPQTEVERLLRLIADGYGRLEENVFPMPAGTGLAEALEMVESAAAEAETVARSVVEASSN